MEQYKITGMSCSACSARVEKAVGALSGVEECSVNLLTNSMTVKGSATAGEIIRAVEKAGYGAAKRGSGRETNGGADELSDKESPVLMKRLFVSLGFLLVLLYFSMGYTMWDLPLPRVFEENPSCIALVQLLLSGIVMVINQKFFIKGFSGLWHRAPNMDTLVALGSMASFLYSTFLVFRMLAEQPWNSAFTHSLLHGLYFESGAMILVLITLGKMLEARSKGKTTNAIKSLMALTQKTATVLKDGELSEIPAEEVRIGDVFVLRAGDIAPVDGVIAEGEGSVDESALTGESIPVDKRVGDRILAASINRSGYILCRAERVGEDTTLSEIIRMVSESAATKAPIAKAADKISGIFVPLVMGISLLTFAIWLLLGEGVGYSLIKGVSVLVISCPCALGLATPVAVMVGNGKGASSGILFKTAAALERTGKCTVAVLDKTGTLTKGVPYVTDVLCGEGVEEGELWSVAYSLEKKSEHPLAKAVVEKGTELSVHALDTESFETLAGNGVRARIFGEIAIGAKADYVRKHVRLGEKTEAKIKELSEKGKTPLLFCLGERFLGIIAVADVLKEDSAAAVEQLRGLGLRVIMLTGDNERTGRAVAALAGIDEVIANVLPDGKDKAIRELQKTEKVIMVGDGINDAVALTGADIGIAVGAGADVAIDAADVVLVNSTLCDVAAAVRLSRRTLRNIHENLFWAFIYNVVGIPLAAGAFTAFGIELSPMFGAAAMSLSSVCVVTNALRLNFVDIHSGKRDRKIKKKTKKEKNKMEKVMKIEGMMCPHCEQRVKKCLEELLEVKEAIVSHESASARVILDKDISTEVLKKTVEGQGYTVLGIE